MHFIYCYSIIFNNFPSVSIFVFKRQVVAGFVVLLMQTSPGLRSTGTVTSLKHQETFLVLELKLQQLVYIFIETVTKS